MYQGRYNGQAWGEAAVVTVRGSHMENEQARLVALQDDFREFVEAPDMLFRNPAFEDGIWEAAGVSRGLLMHAIREGAVSDFIAGTEPELWSPLGAVRPEWLPRWRGLGELADEYSSGEGPGSRGLTRAVFNEQDMSRGPVIGFAEAGLGVGAIGVAWDAFIAPLPADSVSLEIRFDEHSSPDRVPSEADVLNAAPLGELDEVVCWRVYTGRNSRVRDFVTSAADGAHRIVRGAQEGGAVVVGRILRVAAGRTDSTRGDPWARSRRFEAELADRGTADSCPDIDDDVTTRGMAIVVVHGTMSTGLALARTISQLAAPAAVPVLRYEHDTWLPLERNAQDLANLIQLRVKSSVLLVAHSRGGLVSTRAAQILRTTAPGRVGGVITLGTPFGGTPLAMGATVGAAAMRALMGGLRMVGGPVVDAGTRLLPIAMRFDPPPGITVMRPRAGELPMLREFMFPRTKVIAGDATTGAGDVYGPYSQGVAKGAFGETEHDLVVSVDSAMGDRVDGLLVESDHYTYLLRDQVRNELGDRIHDFGVGSQPLVW
jgi:pimeloyl-ACP methyl ester carboxylesterase